MLVLSRKQSQRIKLGDSIVITVVRVAGDKVRLGIDAPRDMLVLRDELEPHAAAVVGTEIELSSAAFAGLSRSA
jgi:carbon storage regulator